MTATDWIAHYTEFFGPQTSRDIERSSPAGEIYIGDGALSFSSVTGRYTAFVEVDDERVALVDLELEELKGIRKTNGRGDGYAALERLARRKAAEKSGWFELPSHLGGKFIEFWAKHKDRITFVEES